jgi:choline monooxygenase
MPMPNGSPTVPLPETLPASWYWDEDVYQAERHRIFWRHWALVARAEQLVQPGQWVADDIAGWPIFVVRGPDGALRGFHNVCRHRAGPLVQGSEGRCRLLRCPYHGWVYGFDGLLRKAPGIPAGAGLDPRETTLFGVRVDVWNSLVFACLAPNGPSLVDWLGAIPGIAEAFPAVADMDFIGAVNREGDANWKGYSDNSCEGYHVAQVHKGLSAAVSRDRMTVRPYERGQFVGFDVHYQGAAEDRTPRGRAFWIYKFPCLLLHFSGRALNVERVRPLGPRRLGLQRWFWSAAAAEDAAEAMQRSKAVMDEDLAICEAVQRNLAAGIYRTGRLAPESEAGTVYFQTLVREALTDAGAGLP